MLSNAGMFQVSSSYPPKACSLASGLFTNVQWANVTKQQAASKQILRWANGKCKHRQGKARGETKESFLVGANSQPQSQPRVTEKEEQYM